MAALLIRRRRPIGEPATAARNDPGRAALRAASPPAIAATYDGIAGAGRIVQSLAELGVTFESIRQLVLEADAPISTLETVDLGDRFPTVALGSHLMNLPDEPARRAFLGVARRHLAPGGMLLVEHHPLDWAETAAEVRATPGGSLGMVDVRRHAPFVSAVSVYDIGGRVVRQPFTARVLSEAELAAAVRACSLSVRRRLSPTWLEAAER